MRARPASTTYRMPGTVSDVSATLVASTTRRRLCRSKTLCCSADDSRAYSGTTSNASAGRVVSFDSTSAVSRISRSPGRNTRMSPGPSAVSSCTASTIASVWSRTTGLALLVVVGLLDQRPVADLHRVGAPGDLHDRRVPEVGAEPLRVDRRRGDDDLEVGPPRQQLLEVAEDEVDVEAALVGLVDDQGVVGRQHPVVLELGEQDAVGHQLDQRVLAAVVGEPDLVADGLPERAAELLGDPLGDAAGGDPAGLGVPDQAVHAAPELEADLRQLRGLARTRSPPRRSPPGGRGSRRRCPRGAR